jgi:stress-induced morphogen
MRSKEQEVFNPHDICVIVDLSYFNLSFKKSYFNLLFLIFLIYKWKYYTKKKKKSCVSNVDSKLVEFELQGKRRICYHEMVLSALHVILNFLY